MTAEEKELMFFKRRKHSKLPLVPVSRLWQMAIAEHMVLAVKQNLYLLVVCIFNQEYECCCSSVWLVQNKVGALYHLHYNTVMYCTRSSRSSGVKGLIKARLKNKTCLTVFIPNNAVELSSSLNRRASHLITFQTTEMSI